MGEGPGYCTQENYDVLNFYRMGSIADNLGTRGSYPFCKRLLHSCVSGPLDIGTPKCIAPIRPYVRPSTILHAGSTVDAEDLAVDPLAVLGCEEADDAGDVDGETDTVQG